jgi:hypothetical protein
MTGRREKSAYIQNQEKAEEKRHKAQIHKDNVEIVAALDRLSGEIKIASDKQESTEAKNNWREWFGVAGIYVASAIAIWAICRASTDAGDQKRVMQGQLSEMQAEQRPWIAPVVRLNGRIFRERDNFATPLAFVLKNEGRLPALQVTLHMSAEVRSLPINFSQVDYTECDKFRKEPWANIGGGTVFPNHATDEELRNPSVKQSDYANLVDKNGFPLILIFGCVDYHLPDSEKHHQSRFAYTIGMAVPLGVQTLPADPTSVNIKEIGTNQGMSGTAD